MSTKFPLSFYEAVLSLAAELEALTSPHQWSVGVLRKRFEQAQRQLSEMDDRYSIPLTEVVFLAVVLHDSGSPGELAQVEELLATIAMPWTSEQLCQAVLARYSVRVSLYGQGEVDSLAESQAVEQVLFPERTEHHS